jgi:DNA polymerase-3 subunit alpha
VAIAAITKFVVRLADIVITLWKSWRLKMFDLHRHDEFSFYDGSGKAKDLAILAKEKGFTALGLTNHGNTSGNIIHYDACKAAGIKPIMGCEGYFLPKYKPQNRGYHLILIAKDVEGYRNLNIIQSKGEEQKYYNPIWTFDLLEKYHEGLICTSACVASYSSQCILNGKIDLAKKYLKRMQTIFGDDFYIEIQPYKVSEKGMQETVNVELIKLSKELKIKMVLTSDSHRGAKEDIEVYIKMHQLKNNDAERLKHVRETYDERYMPDLPDMKNRFIKMHSKDFGKEQAIIMADKMYANLEEIEAKVSDTIIDDIASMPTLPKFDENIDAHKLLIKKIKQGMKDRGVYNKSEYRQRIKDEMKVVSDKHFEDYFLIVQDYVNWAKEQGITVGPGRGSGCNCLLNYVLKITDVDPIYFKLDYRRFINPEKTKLPDIDIDFETARRGEVIDYLINKFPGYSCRIASYGTFKTANLINDLAKTYDDFSAQEIANVKKIVGKYRNVETDVIDSNALLRDSEVIQYNKKYKYFFDAFVFLYSKVKFMGTHASGAAVAANDIYYYTAIRLDKDGNKFSAYNLNDLERIGIVKYDLLGLGTMQSIGELRRLTGKNGLTEEDFTDEKIMAEFEAGKTNGVFQYDKRAAQDILIKIHANNINDIIAASAMNRPGPLSMGIPSHYAKAKEDWTERENKPVYAELVDETYGNILYQEQIIGISNKYGGLTYNDADKVRKMGDLPELVREYGEEYTKTFVKGMARFGVSESDAKDLFQKFISTYSFNKGHATGYGLISLEEMYYKVYYPELFWYVKLKQTDFDKNGAKFLSEAVSDGIVVFLPHVNYTAEFSIRKVDGEYALQMGMNVLKGVGDKAAYYIEQERKANGIFTSFDNFYDRCKSRLVTSRVIDILKEQGALEFNKKIYLSRVTKYNSTLFAKSENLKR